MRAISIPVEELSERFKELPREAEIIAFCRGHYVFMQMKLSLLLKEGFNQAAKEYDKWFDEHVNLFSSELTVLKLAVPQTGKGIEIGVGTGRFARELGIKTGVEPSAKMGAIASARGITVIPGYAENIPVEDASCDYLLMVTVDCFLQNPLKAFQEAWRLIKPGDSIIIGMIDR